ncbi:ROK family transcriptional regulator [Puniceibacterium sp. IMCC21224]|uniref:ROK family transcriptional regulator n=1 Tax=Puniceibacterium sp. IMCC21224 TaxID=1618204 RepID=UPI00064DCB7C|nr:ROK family transcriptional regulator [Puniceibacterium sp. IMCC21224]KMK66228.1 transcriptional regulator, MarR family [Puniceibacterium sp. IMCC21224]
MDHGKHNQIAGGINQSGVRAHNERLLLSTLQRHGPMPGSELAKVAGLSAQTVSVILRSLEAEGFLERGQPLRGKVGKPSIPMTLAPNGAISFGLKLGRRSADLVLMGFHGQIMGEMQITYDYPMPEDVFEFLDRGIAEMSARLTAAQRDRICGIGIAAPHEMWNWLAAIGAPADKFEAWKRIDFNREVARFSTHPVFVENDATAACRAEHTFGKGLPARDYAYFFVGSFIGGGVVLNHMVVDGNQGNAGSFGSLRSIGTDGTDKQLIDTASLYLLDADLRRNGIETSGLWQQPQNWSNIATHVDRWIDTAAPAIASAIISVCAVIDFEAVVIDGGFPADVRMRLVAQVAQHLPGLDSRGIKLPRVEEGSVGGNARAIGAACTPVFAQFFLNTNREVYCPV